MPTVLFGAILKRDLVRSGLASSALAKKKQQGKDLGTPHVENLRGYEAFHEEPLLTSRA